MRHGVLKFGLILVLAACGGGSSYTGVTNPPPPGPVLTTSVSLKSIAFAPAAIQVSPGATVTFTNMDGFNHNVTFSDATITSVPNFASGSRQVVMPTTPGTYSYRCTIHSGMTGTVKVQ